jgi:hypothetical protein
LWCKHAGSKYDLNLECDLPLCMFPIASGRSPVSASVEVSAPRSEDGDNQVGQYSPPQVVESLTSDDGVVGVADVVVKEGTVLLQVFDMNEREMHGIKTVTSGHSECLETTGSPHGGACGQPKGCPTPLVRLWPL